MTVTRDRFMQMVVDRVRELVFEAWQAAKAEQQSDEARRAVRVGSGGAAGQTVARRRIADPGRPLQA